MLTQLLTIVITCVVHNADCKRKDPELLQAKIVNVKKHIFQCPRNSFVVGFNMNNKRVHCRKFGESAEKRTSKFCKWCRKCYNSDGKNQENFRIARGLRFVFKKSRNFMAKKQVKQVQLYCCKQDCESFDCKLKLFHKPVIGTHLKKMNFINYAIYEKWENVLKAEFCKPKCLPNVKSDNSITGAIGPDSQPCDRVPCSTWGPWQTWSQCSAASGGGWSRKRARTCPVPDGCPGLSVDESRCNLSSYCLDWGSWSMWSDCSISCGGGSKTRIRSLVIDNVCGPVDKMKDVQPKTCNTQPCPTWEEWGQWSGCTMTCGDQGDRFRNRVCKHGTECMGGSKDFEPCRLEPCQGTD